MSEQAGASTRVLTVPNLISLVRLLLVPVFAVLLVQHRDGWALVVLAVSGASDWLDGVVARRWNQVSRLGQLLDPAADRLFILVTIVTLAWRGVVPWWLVVVLVFRDLAPGEIDEMAGIIVSELARPVANDVAGVAVNASIGVVDVHPNEQRTADELLRDADLAMYAAKRARRSGR